MSSNSKREWIDAWAAGIVDGDGCIAIKLRTGIKSSVKYYTLFVIVAQSGKKMPKMIKTLLDVYGGNVDKPYQSKKPNRLLRWTWYVACKQAEVFLAKVTPYLIQKRDQAEIALEFRKNAIGKPGKRRKGVNASAIQESYYLKLRDCKNYTKTNKKYWEDR